MSRNNPIYSYRITDHARGQMARRGISESAVVQVLTSPEQVVTYSQDQAIYQSRMTMGEPPRTYLLRVFADVNREPVEVVTVYRTSKVEKYWRSEDEGGL